MIKNEENHLFTTGQVSGMTWLAQNTLYKYTQEFPQYFSSTATQHKKGRRWTSADLEVIQAIRTLKHSRLGHDKTAGALASGYRDVLSPMADREEFSRLAATLLVQSDEAKIALEKNTQAMLYVKAFVDRVIELEGYFDALTDYVAKLGKLNKLAHIFGLDPAVLKHRYQ